MKKHFPLPKGIATLCLFVATILCALPTRAQTTFGEQQIIAQSDARSPYDVYATDLDGDGYTDILSASADDDKIAWYKNSGNGNFGAQQVISTNADYATSVYAADLDNDGDNDVLAASAYDNKIAWYENDGTGNFDAEQIITTDAYYAISVYATDLNGDGDNDVISASQYDDKIAWYENLTPVSITTPQLSHPTPTKAYPNPIKDWLYIEHNDIDNPNAPYILYNMLGMAVLSGKLEGNTAAVSVLHLPSGVYCLHLGGDVVRVVKQ